MTEDQVQSPAPAPANGESVSKGDGYEAKYIRVSKVQESLVDDTGGVATKIRISGDARDAVMKFFDDAVVDAAKVLIGKLPRITKGENKGQLKRITLQIDDLTGKPAVAE